MTTHWPRIYDGSATPPPPRLPLRAGALTLDWQDGMLRAIRAGGVEVVRGIYAAVRDHNWGTVPGVISDLDFHARADSFAITFTSTHQQGEIHYVWQGSVTGTADGVITYTFDGEARSAFARNRIGFCVLHPADAAGAALTVTHTDGATEDGAFPERIAPHQPYFDIRALTHTAAPGLRAEVVMEGDAFEMEDQRNWTDASFKTYCTPLARPFPVTVQPGDRVRQTITVRLHGTVPNIGAGDDAPRITVHHEGITDLPNIGLCVASDDAPLTPREIERLAALNLRHLRVDVRLDAPDLEARLTRAWEDAQAIGAGRLEIAALVSAHNTESEPFARFQAILDRLQITGKVIVMAHDAPMLSDRAMRQALAALGGNEPPILLGFGTLGYFTQLNRAFPILKVPLLAYAVNPQVHAFDNDSLIETLPMLGLTVQMAQVEWQRPGASGVRVGDDAIWVTGSGGGFPVATTPVTFRIGHNPDATAADPPTPPGELPRRVDARQMSLFGAGWTLGALASLAGVGTYSVTLFETTGWLGVMERAAGSPLPDRFPSIPDAVYPLYHVLADVGAYRGGWHVATTSSHPQQVSALAVRNSMSMRLLIANHTAQRQTVSIDGIDPTAWGAVGSAETSALARDSGEWGMIALDEFTAEAALRDPAGWRRQAMQTVPLIDGLLRVTLNPYAVVTLHTLMVPTLRRVQVIET